MSFLDRAAPWNSPVVPSIPLPPFADEAAHGQYVRMLQLHLAFLDGGSPSLPTIALSLALERPRYPTEETDVRWLTPLELAVSLTTWFPAPWSPAALAETLVRTEQDAPVHTSGGSWHWLYDPDFTAVPKPDGSWDVTRHERGSHRTESLASDRDLVVFWIHIFRKKFVFPLANRRDSAELAALAPASLAVMKADEQDAAYPYRESWREDRAAALGPDPS